jgi:hypothetical protein
MSISVVLMDWITPEHPDFAMYRQGWRRQGAVDFSRQDNGDFIETYWHSENHFNATFNINAFPVRVGFLSAGLYNVFSERNTYKSAKDAIPDIERGLPLLTAYASESGLYDRFEQYIELVKETLRQCQKYPDAGFYVQ